MDRLLAHPDVDSVNAKRLLDLRARLNPFELSKAIERKLQSIYRLANSRLSPSTAVGRAA